MENAAAERHGDFLQISKYRAPFIYKIIGSNVAVVQCNITDLCAPHGPRPPKSNGLAGKDHTERKCLPTEGIKFGSLKSLHLEISDSSNLFYESKLEVTL